MKGSSIRMEASLIEDDPAAEGFERRADRPQPGQRRLDRGVALGGGEEQQESTSACAQDLAADRAGAARRVVPAVDVAATDARGNALLSIQFSCRISPNAARLSFCSSSRRQ